MSPRDLVLKIKESREFEGRSRRIGVFSKTQELQFRGASDSRWFGTSLEARESLQRTRRTVSIMCIKNETKIHYKKHKRDGIGLILKPRWHKEDGASFPNQIQYKVSQIHNQNLL